MNRLYWLLFFNQVESLLVILINGMFFFSVTIPTIMDKIFATK